MCHKYKLRLYSLLCMNIKLDIQKSVIIMLQCVGIMKDLGFKGKLQHSEWIGSGDGEYFVG